MQAKKPGYVISRKSQSRKVSLGRHATCVADGSNLRHYGDRFSASIVQIMLPQVWNSHQLEHEAHPDLAGFEEAANTAQATENV